MTLFAFLLPLASAHDGGFGHSRRTIYLSASSEGLIVEYRIKQGTEEGLVELVRIDADRDGQISQAEKDSFFRHRGRQLLKELSFAAAEGPSELPSKKLLPVAFESYQLGHSLVQVYRFTVKGEGRVLFLQDRNFTHKPGQIAVEMGPGLKAELAAPADLSHAEQVLLKITKTSH